MLLKNLMEDNQLNFYQPLLSVRRNSSTAPPEKVENKKSDNSLPKLPPLPSYKSELKSGPIRDPGTVPFVWEHSPGRPKDGSRQRNHATERPPIAPKPPPGRILERRKQHSDRTVEHSGGSKYHGEIPYVSCSDASKLDSSKDSVEVESSDSAEGDEEYLDALDTLSRTESMFLNCSVSGISGLEGSGLNTSGNFSIDQQNRDFMMDRFLPAAKAMTSEAPQYAPIKQAAVREKPRQLIKVISGSKRPPLRYVSRYAQEKVEEEGDDDYDEHEQLPTSVCGLLPSFCLKNSFCLLNPAPGMSVRTRIPMSPGNRTYVSSASAGSCSGNENEQIRATVYEQRSVVGHKASELHEDTSVTENRSDKLIVPSYPQKLDGSVLHKQQESHMLHHHNELPKSTFSDQDRLQSIPGEAKNSEMTSLSSLEKSSTVYEQRLGSKLQETELNQDTGVPNEQSDQISYPFNLHIPEGSALYRRLQGSSMPAHHYDLPRTIVSEERKGVVGITRESKDEKGCGLSTFTKDSSIFKELLVDLSRNREADSGSPKVEKTLYVEIVHKVKSPGVQPYDSAMKGLPKMKGHDFKDLEKGKALEENHLVDKKEIAQKLIDFSVPSLADKPNKVLAAKVPKGFKQYEDHSKDFTTSQTSGVPNSAKRGTETPLPLKAEESKKCIESYSKLPTPPPLPKSPSDSWLCRTLPSMSSRTSPLQPNFRTRIHPRNQASKTFSVDPKWETIVKTTKGQRQHELLPSISET